MKEGAEKVELKIQAKVESLKNVNEGDKGKVYCLFDIVNRFNCKALFFSFYSHFEISKHFFLDY